MDVHIPRAVTIGLRLRLIDVLTAQEDGTAEWTDERLLGRATSLSRLFVSQNDDFLSEGARWLRNGRSFSGIVYVRAGIVGQNRVSAAQMNPN